MFDPINEGIGPMRTGMLDGARAAEPRLAWTKLGLWLVALARRLAPPDGVMREDEMPDWIKRDIGWRDGPAERPRAELEGWSRREPSGRSRTD